MTLPERVLLVHDYGGCRGGAELLALEIRRRLRGRGIDARLATSDADPFERDDAPDYVFRGSTGPLRALRETANPSLVRVLRGVLRDFDPQVVHLGMILTQASPLLLPLLAGVPTVFLVDDYRPVCPRGTRLLPGGAICESRPGRPCRDNGCFGLKGWVPRMVQLALYRRWRGSIDRTIAPSGAMARVLEAYGQEVEGVIPHGVPERPVPEAALSPVPLVAYAGRLVPEKGVDVLLRAAARARRECPTLRVRVVGDGPDRCHLESLAGRIGLGGEVEFLGHHSWARTQELLGEAWVQCVPSLWDEPFGLVTAEAQMRGTAVVASRVGAQPELIAHGETGYLFDPGDHEGLAAILRSVVADPAARARVALAGQRRAQRELGVETMIDRFLTVYGELLQPTGDA